jgi:hypothetical protein
VAIAFVFVSVSVLAIYYALYANAVHVLSSSVDSIAKQEVKGGAK